MGDPRERHPGHAAAPGAGPAADRGDGGGGHQVAGRVVEDRQRPPVRLADAGPRAARQRHSGAVLHQRVEAAAVPPRAGPAVGAERDLDEPGRDGLPGRLAQPEAVEGARAQPVHEDICVRQQTGEERLPLAGREVERRAPLAEGEVARADAVGLVVAGRVDPQHLRPESGQQAGRHRPGQRPGDVKDAQPRQRAPGHRLPVAAAPAGRRDVHERLGRHGGAGRMRGPLPDAAAGGGRAAARHDGRLQVIGSGPGDRGRDRVAVGAGAEHGQGGPAQVRVVGLEAEPAPVRGGEVARHRVEGRARRRPQRPHRPVEQPGRQRPVHHRLRAGAAGRGRQFGDRRAGAGQAGRPQVGHRVRPAQNSGPGEPDGAGVDLQRRGDIGQEGVRGAAHPRSTTNSPSRSVIGVPIPCCRLHHRR